MRPNIESGIVQARFHIDPADKQSLVDIAQMAGTDSTSIVKAVMVQTKGQWLQLYTEYLQSIARNVEQRDSRLLADPKIKIT